LRTPPHPLPGEASSGTRLGLLDVFGYSRRALALVWTTNKTLCIALGLLTVAAGVIPAGIAYVGSLIVDAVIHAADLHRRAGTTALHDVVTWVALEALLVAATSMTQRGMSLAQSLLRAQLGQRVNVMILEKALTLDLTHFEDSEFYDKLTRARREASSRPLSLVMRTFALLQNAVSLISFGGLLVRFSPWAVVLLVLAGLPAFLAEAKFSGEAFRLFRWRAPEHACRCISSRCWRARTRPKRSNCSSWDRACWIAIEIFSPGCIAKIATSPCAAMPGVSAWGSSARHPCTAAMRGSPWKPCSVP
jgi:ATP-binding cassette subfamily B protein